MSKYDDIINLPHPISKKHPHMSNINRGAQFAPFAALTGFGEQIIETGRSTLKKLELDDYQKYQINDMLLYIKENKNVKISIVYFVKDKLKEGGQYLSLETETKKLDEDHHQLILMDGNTIDIDDILSISLM